jgi:hypothetical protein
MDWAMDYKTFRGKTLNKLQEETGIPGNVWSLYFNDRKKMTETTLDRAAEGLCIEPPELLRFIRLRRAEKLEERQNLANK